MNLKNEVYTGATGRQSLVDLEIPEKFNGEIILFVHGFMGFKDWGAWHLVMGYFIQKGYGFCKFNTTHNGGTIQNGIDFTDPVAFGNNTYSKELEDVKSVVNWIDAKVNHWNGHLIGHSKGGAIALIAGSQIEQIKSISTWAAIASIGERFPNEGELNEWKEKGVRHVKNGRTLQQLPQKYSLYTDYIHNVKTFDLKHICKTIKKPIFIAHGENDSSVNIENGLRLSKWAKIDLCTIDAADHVFDSRHPWTEAEMPYPLLQLCEKTESFLFEQK